jgi:hypothetical protein
MVGGRERAGGDSEVAGEINRFCRGYPQEIKRLK